MKDLSNLYNSTNLQLKNYFENMLLVYNYHKSSSTMPRTMYSIQPYNRIYSLLSNENLRLFSTINIRRVCYTTVDYTKSKITGDYAVLFKIQDKIHFVGRTTIFTVDDDEILLKSWPLSDIRNL